MSVFPIKTGLFQKMYVNFSAMFIFCRFRREGHGQGETDKFDNIMMTKKKNTEDPAGSTSTRSGRTPRRNPKYK